ncbi:hypothetical protein ES703_60080 [subsurface metagenome]
MEEKVEKGYGGKMEIGFTASLETLACDAGSMYTNWGCLYYLLVYDTPEHFKLPPDYYSFSPRLIKSYETSEDRTTWTIQLVENVRWHDGRPVTAEDLKFSIDYLYARPEWTDVDFAVESVEVAGSQ